MSRIPETEKILAVKAYLQGEGTTHSQAARLGVAESTFREWVTKYKTFGESGLRSSTKRMQYAAETKNAAVTAYLILAGSILEAVLIDWLSDIDGVNYFVEEYYVTDYRTGKQKRAELIDYINQIKYIERPHWMEEASKAHVIRKKRNLVHAKLCMKSDEVNETVCRQVIDYLKDVLKTRGIQ